VKPVQLNQHVFSDVLCYKGFGYAELNIGDAGIAECSAMPIQLKISAVNLNIACIIACDAEI
jgi:hypothetical protein